VFAKKTYLEGNCKAFSFQFRAVSSSPNANISNCLDPKATTQTSGWPNTNTPLVSRSLQGRFVRSKSARSVRTYGISTLTDVVESLRTSCACIYTEKTSMFPWCSNVFYTYTWAFFKECVWIINKFETK
jgi:hypothetical protein